MQFFRVKDFEKLQHYKDRSPPWIKLYNEILDDYKFGSLPDASKMHLIAIMLLASRSENKLPLDSDWLAKRINATEPVDLNILIRSGFIIPDQEVQSPEHDASRALAQCLTREREEGETEKRRDSTPNGVSKYVFEDGIIRLNHKDFGKWEEAYEHLDLRSELMSLSHWATEQGEKNWFHAVKGALSKRNREMALRHKTAASSQVSLGDDSW